MNKKVTLTIVCGFLLFVNIFFVSAVSIREVSTNPSEAIPGGKVDVSLEIKNNLDFDITDLNIKLDLSSSPFAPFKSGSEEFLAVLDSDESEDLTFNLITLPETPSGIYKIPVQIIYEDDESRIKTKNETISIIVNSLPELKISSESETLIRGRDNELSVKIINSGLSDVKFVYLSLTDVVGVKILSEKEQYLGDLDSDDFDTLNYNIFVSSTSSNTINLPVVIKYKDAANEGFTETKNLPLKIYSLGEARDLGLADKPSYTLYIILIIIILIYLVYRFRKRRKLKKLKQIS